MMADDSSPSTSAANDRKDSMTCAELEFNDITLIQKIGRGAYGLVWKAYWQNQIVAVKMIESEMERRALVVELAQLKRVNHENIVQLFGYCTKAKYCLVMEYMDGGSLYDVLHGFPKFAYTAGHALSWTLQCAKGVEYLHNMKPKPLIHRDLKPPNLLLCDKYRHLKICDFGTACDLHTTMTNNKGSAAWMAPEVFEGSKYGEKCDVFSFGIILWEILSRRKPFEEVGGPAFRIMWAVHNGSRPPPVRNCPPPLEKLMTSCWSRDPEERPSFTEIRVLLEQFEKYFTGGDQPLKPEQEVDDVEMKSEDDNSKTETDSTMSAGTDKSKLKLSDAIPVPIPSTFSPSGPFVNVIESPLSSLPGSNFGSTEDMPANRRSVDARPSPLSNSNGFVKGHRRGGSHETVLIQTDHTEPDDNLLSPGEIRRVQSSETDFRSRAPSYPGVKKPNSYRSHPSIPEHIANGTGKAFSDENMLSCELPPAYMEIELHLRPLAPIPDIMDSVQIFNDHCLLSDEFLKVQDELKMLRTRKEELIKIWENWEQEQKYKRLLEKKKLLEEKRQALRNEIDRKNSLPQSPQ